MRSLALKTIVLLAICWVALANVDMVASAARALRNAKATIATKIDLYQIANLVGASHEKFGEVPRSLRTFIPNSSSLRVYLWGPRCEMVKDPWGGYYEVVRKGTGFVVLSAGPDRRWRTRDDLTYFRSLAEVLYDRKQ